MGPPTLAMDSKRRPEVSSDAFKSKVETKQHFASVNTLEQNPVDFLRVLFEGSIAGGAAGVIVETALYPIDTIKTRLQAVRGGGKILLKGLYSGLGGNLAGVLPSSADAMALFVLVYNGFVLNNISPSFGAVLHSYPLTFRIRMVHYPIQISHFVPNCDKSLMIEFCHRDPASAIFVGVYEPAKQKLLKIFPENLSALAHLTAGAIGGAASSLVRVPTEVVKQRMQTGQFASASNAVRLIVSKEGFRGLYAGYGSFLLRDLPFDAIQFCLYEQLRIGYKLAAKRELNDPENAIIGAFAGTRKPVQRYFDCVQTIVREEGAPALLKGIGPRVLWIGIGGSIFWCSRKNEAVTCSKALRYSEVRTCQEGLMPYLKLICLASGLGRENRVKLLKEFGCLYSLHVSLVGLFSAIKAETVKPGTYNPTDETGM
ncbi:hypothetical protein IFM89_019350 [Coptis chinensis]|uniref:Mitochondrial carrier protein n=1 Tax=Coptis chinensis TaxID=261450 RepID=A0A835I4F4_9MAGN|nr:hypothetical protein IFM89_019350 [Coptis chinensis]